MKTTRLALSIAILTTALFASGVHGQFQGLPTLPGSLADLGDVKINPYAQIGYQRVGANITLPVDAETSRRFRRFILFSLDFDTMDVWLQGSDFWSGIAGVNIVAKEMYSCFFAAGGVIPRNFDTVGTFPVNVGITVGPFGREDTFAPNFAFTNTKVESWFMQAGIGLGPVIGGVYWDHFAFVLGDPRIGSEPMPNQTLRGDLITKTTCPFVGIAMPISGAMVSIMYSPYALSNTTLVLRNSEDRVDQLEFAWNKPGHFLAGMVQYNTSLTTSTSFGLWANGSWMQLRSDVTGDFVSSNPAVSASQEVHLSMGRYSLGGGVTLEVNF